MTITDLKKYAERMNERLLPTDRLRVTLTREATSIIGAFLSDRKKSVEKSLADQNTKPSKRASRERELVMINDALQSLDKAEKI